MLKTVVVIDYQNMHTTGFKRFFPEDNPKGLPLNPVKFSDTLIAQRNSKVKSEWLLAGLSKIEVFRGLPSSVHDPKAHAQNIEQMNKWSLDTRLHLVHRPLKYIFSSSDDPTDRTGRYLSKTEKGIDVLCALSIVRHAIASDTDLIIVASHDSDLEPALEEALRISPNTRLETASWFNPSSKTTRSRLNPRTSKKLWNNSLGRDEYLESLDF